MANQIEMAKINAIQGLHQQGWSQRKIATQLGVNRETVARYLSEATSKPAKAPPGSEDSKPTKAPSGSTGQRSDCQPYRSRIVELLDQGLSAKRIHQDLCDEGFAGSYYSVRRFVSGLRNERPLPFRRIETAAGEEAQIDFGTGAPALQENGRKRRTYVLRVVLSHSRKAYSESVYQQTTENFIRCIENAFRHFGGAPKTLVIDNLRAAVKKVDWFEPELNPKVEAFCQHYDVVILPTRPRMPRHKGKVEKGIDYVQSNALKGRVFKTLAEQNAHLRDWEASVADTRIHGTTRKQVGKVFREVEQQQLQKLPLEPFPFFHEGERTVHRDAHVEVDKSYYSVPPEFVGRRVWVRWESRVVRVFNHRMEQVAMHAKVEPGRFSTDATHLSDKKISTVERGTEWFLSKASMIGTFTEQWAQEMIRRRGVQGMRTLQGLLSLAKKHDCQQIERACEIAHSYGAYRLANLRRLIERGGAKQQQLELTDEHPLIRNIEVYGELVRTSFRDQAKRLGHGADNPVYP